jgi:hypothetical protein
MIVVFTSVDFGQPCKHLVSGLDSLHVISHLGHHACKIIANLVRESAQNINQSVLVQP